MGLRVSTNVAAINATRNLSTSQRNIQKSLGQLASGNRINKAADDAAGLAISDNLRGTIRSARQARRNAETGISMIQVAEGGLNEIGNIVTRLRELGIQAGSDTISDVERCFIDKEVQQLKSEIDRISNVTTWGKTKLLDGQTPSFDFQIGVFADPDNDRISFNAGENSASLDALGLSSLDYNGKESAQGALDPLDMAIEKINGSRSSLGALQNRLQSTVTNLGISEENMQAAKSRILDTDVAEASAELTRNNILLQASTSTLAQANQVSSIALKLIG